MANDLVWTKRMLGAFIEQGCLNEEEQSVLTDWAYGRSVVETSMRRCMSTRRVDKIRSRLRLKYDAVQREYPDVFPMRKT